MIDSTVYVARLPAIVEAVFVMPGEGAEAERARAVHRRLLRYYEREYALCPAPAAEQLPLLEFDNGAAAEGRTAFRLLHD